MDWSMITGSSVVCFLGTCVFLRVILYVIYSVYDLLRIMLFPMDLKGLGEWAVVTGATDGIGKQFVRQLSKMGINVILISRNEDKLRSTAKEIENDYNVKTRYIQADFKSRDCYSHIEEGLKDLDIGILINNVGISSLLPTSYMKFSQEDLWNSIDVNVGSAVIMTRIIIPQMKAKRRGLIVNVGSMASEVGLPRFGIYAATKSFLKMFTLNLEEEALFYNIKVRCLEPGLVKTKLLDGVPAIKNSVEPMYMKLLLVDVKDYASYAIKALSSGSTIITGYWLHTIHTTLCCWMPLEYKLKAIGSTILAVIHQEKLKNKENQ